jgi:hypothetical protein
MPRNERVVVVLVASPSDLEAERNRLEDIVRELNLTWSRTLGLRLELVRWETHGYPGLGQDPQDVLNRELTDEPDIFIGLMWGRYGTPTGRAGSGTEEEFKRALERHRQDSQAVRIMFYFKDAPLAPSAIDPDQLGRVQGFRASLGSEGSLYWKFNTLEEFERLLRLHLARQIQQFVARDPSRPGVGAPTLAEGTVLVGEDQQEELGLLDFLDLVDEHFGVLNEITGRISRETSSLGERMLERTREIIAAKDQAQGHISLREARALIEKAAGDMTQYVARMSAEIPLFREALRKGANAAARASLISAAMASEDRRQVREARGALVMFRDGLTSAYDSNESFKATIQGLPRMTAVLNKAKRDVAAVIQDVLDSIAEGRRVITETIKALDVLLGDEPGV